MRHIITLILLIISQTLIAQQNSGAIRTHQGILLYFNLGENSHTLNLEGDVDLSSFPFIKQDKRWFQFFTENKRDFGKEPNSILVNYMNWEIKYHQKQTGNKLKAENEIFNRNGIVNNFWKYINPVINLGNGQTPVVATYFLDFIHKDLIYRISYPSISGDDTEAKAILFNIVDNIKFYDHNIDLGKLQKNIINGQNYYIE